MVQLTRTTIQIEEELLKEAKKRAIDEEKTLRELIKEALEEKLEKPQKKVKKKRKKNLKFEDVFEAWPMGVKGKLTREEIYDFL